MTRLHSIFSAEARQCRTLRISGQVLDINGSTIRVFMPGVSLRDRLAIERHAVACSTSQDDEPKALIAEVIACQGSRCILSPLSPPLGIRAGATVRLAGTQSLLCCGPQFLGRVLDSQGRIQDSVDAEVDEAPRKFLRLRPQLRNTVVPSPAALSRKSINELFTTGIRAIDGFLTMGHGQRVGLFAEPGVGKSSLLGALAANSSADVVVIALVGERGREVGEFVRTILPAGMRQKSVVVFSTGEEPALARVNAALIGVTMAEYFRDCGFNVLFLVDSLTRLCRAYREIGLAGGEPAVRRGYPPSVFSRLPEFIERTGTNELGSITAMYTVLLSSDLDEDPMVDEIKGITDGHFILRKQLAEKGQYPAIDICASISRLATNLVDDELRNAAQTLRAMLSRLSEDRDLILFGGTPDVSLKAALERETELHNFLTQSLAQRTGYEETRRRLINLASSPVSPP